MFENHELADWCGRNNLTEHARKKIEHIRNSEPSRLVQSGWSNVPGRYPSKKMGRTIQFESHRNELAVILELEHDPVVREYYDQPSVNKLEYDGTNGRHITALHTPDFFVIRDNAAGWEECKTEQELIQLAERNPNRYCRDENGKWRCPPGEAHAELFGFYYIVRTDRAINWTYQRNIQFLEDYLRFDTIPVSDHSRHMICDIVSTVPNMTLQELYLKVEGSVSRDDIHILIAAEVIYVDLRTAPLSDPDKVHMFRDEVTAIAYSNVHIAHTSSAADNIIFLDLAKITEILWDGHVWTILNIGETMVGLLSQNQEFKEIPFGVFEELVNRGKITGASTCSPGSGISSEAMEIMLKARRSDLEEANRRAQVVQSYLRSELIAPCEVPERTLRMWVAAYREAEAKYGCGYFGLIAKSRPGNCKIRLDQATITLLNNFIENDYETLKQKRKYEVYGAYLHACEKKVVAPASYKTFCRAIKRRSSFEQISKRQGRRAAYKHKPFYWVLDQTTPRHGERPFEIAHIDHTELDLEFVCEQTGRNLGRAWASIMADAFSRRFLAVYVTYDPPSYRSCMMLIRECVRRFGRLPQTIVVDGGMEFESTYFETLLARYECVKRTRPPAESRFGSVCERLFGTINTRFLYNLQGNTQITRNVRQVTKSVNPQKHAVWTLGNFYQRFKQFAYEVYDTTNHPALGGTPQEKFALGMRQSGNRSHRLIPYNEGFLMFTLPTTAKGTAKVCAGQGVKINNIYYWSEAFRNPEVERSSVEVRFDPFDAGTAHAYVDGMWVKCHSEYYGVFRSRSEREIKFATEEVRRLRKLHSRQFNVTAKKLAEFLESVEAEEKLLSQRLRDRETQHIVSEINDKHEDDGEAAACGEDSNPTRDDVDTSNRKREKAVHKGTTKPKAYGRF